MIIDIFNFKNEFFLKSLEKRKKYFIPPQQKNLLVIFFKTYIPEEHKVK